MVRENVQIPDLRHEDEEMLRYYLLGGLSEATRQQVDERLFADNDYFQHLLLVEEELVDDYVSDNLTKDEHEKFSQYFLTNPERVESVAFARAIGGYVEKQHANALPVVSSETRRSGKSWKFFQSFLPNAGPALAWSLIAALVLLVLGASWILIRLNRQTTPGQLQADKAVPQEQPQQQITPPVGEHKTTTQPSPPAPERAPSPGIAQPEIAGVPKNRNEARPPNVTKRPQQNSIQAVFLSAGLVRGEDSTPLVRVPRGESSVVFNLTLIGEVRPAYRAVLIKGEREVRSWPTAIAVSNKSGKFVPLAAPVKNLSEGNYFILLKGAAPDVGWQEVGRYYFQLAKD